MGFKEGMTFPKKTLQTLLSKEVKPVAVLNLQDVLANQEEIDLGEEPQDEETEKEEETPTTVCDTVKPHRSPKP